MSSTHGDWMDAVREAVRAVLVEERLFDGLRDRLPPPNAVDSEQALITNFLAGELDPCLLHELEPEAFWLPMTRWIWERLREGARTVEDLVEAAQGEGATGHRLQAEIASWPVVFAPPVSTHTELIREMAKRRRILETMRQIRIKLELGDLTVNEAVTALRQVAA